MKNKNNKHGLSSHPLYYVWKDMVRRTSNPKSPNYKRYGGRGISVCNDWKNDVTVFYKWAIDNGYKEGLSIDRINNDGNYEPSNCRWTTKDIQSANTRAISQSNKSGYRGVSYHKRAMKYVSRICIKSEHIHIGTFETAFDAALAYDKYIIENKLEHTTNGVVKGDNDVARAV